MKLTGYRSPGRRATRDKLRAMAAPPVAVNCPDMLAEDREFMRLFRESKRAESLGQRGKLNRLITKLKARGAWLEQKARRHAELRDFLVFGEVRVEMES